MAYFILMGRRIPKQAITGFKFQNETDNIRPFLSIRIRGKDEIIPFKDKKEIQSVKAHLCSIFSGFVKNDLVRIRVIKPKKFLGFFRQLTGITIEGAFNGCSACVEIMADDDNGVSMMHYIDYEDIIGVELIKN